MSSSAETLGRRAAMISILAAIYFLVAAIITHVVSTQYNFFSDYISDYAIGSWGWIYGSAFLASCIVCFALAISLTRLISSNALSRTGVVLLAIVGVTYVVDFIFPTKICVRQRRRRPSLEPSIWWPRYSVGCSSQLAPFFSRRV